MPHHLPAWLQAGCQARNSGPSKWRAKVKVVMQTPRNARGPKALRWGRTRLRTSLVGIRMQQQVPNPYQDSVKHMVHSMAGKSRPSIGYSMDFVKVLPKEMYHIDNLNLLKHLYNRWLPSFSRNCKPAGQFQFIL